MSTCCTPTLHAWFKDEDLHRVGLRHGGPFCNGKIEELVKGAYRAQGRQLRTGEVYR